MKLAIKLCIVCILVVFVASCKSVDAVKVTETSDLVLAFGSCNMQYKNNELWKEIIKHQPEMWIWGGDIIYSDTDKKDKMQRDYNVQKTQADYSKLVNATNVVGTWDDHDYGLNDGGEEFHFKKVSQQLFLDFMDIPKNDPRREREGVYSSEIIEKEGGTIKILILDTRYFRTALTKSDDKDKRFQPNKYGEGTILGAQQWGWLANELNDSEADFNIIVSSIQVLSGAHGFETWGNFPHEVDKLKTLITTSKAKNVLLLSGDRHISEFSKTTFEGLNYPLIDFTSSGLTHAYSGFKGEINEFRVGKVVAELSFGLLKFNFKTGAVLMEMRGKGNKLQQQLLQYY
ncbi:alkaline phosphatase D family protein [Mariniflexile sp.]|uniref:alkaline phosphatase D family protein n=1 Tax=Mariniflexile sp. TaxID=1979402 RepID=UPI003567F201